MKRNNNDVVVGTVVLAVAILTVFTVSWVKQVDVGRQQHEVVATFRDVGNARVGNAVVIRGVIGGRIQAIELAPGGWVSVRMKMNPSVQLPKDPVVLLSESSLFGDWQATVVERGALPPDAALRREVEDASRMRGVLPGASQPGMGELTAVAGRIAGDVANVSSRIQTAFDDQAARELRASIRNVAELSSTVRGVVKDHEHDLDTLSSQLRLALRTLNRTAANVEVTARRIDSAATSDEVRSVIENLSLASGELRTAALRVRELTTGLAATQAKADAFLANGDSVLRKLNRGQGSLGLMLNDPSMYRHTDSLVLELRALTADFRANPRKYINLRIF
ncbi:MAG TPA: MlaD family protein [Gemmatimonadaceae bacterium]|nr:MlaD family protein [Gemmatimonadaceae bacterium]